MTSRFVEGSAPNISTRSAAVITGISLLMMTVAAGFSFSFVLDTLIVPGDASATTNQIRASEALFRAGVGGWLLIVLLDAIVAWSLHVLLRRVNNSLSLLTAWLRLVYTAILGISVSNLLGVLFLLRDSNAVTVEAGQVDTLVMYLVNMFYGTWQTIGLVVFGCHLVLLGTLVMRSGTIPKVIGFLVAVGGLGYIIPNVGNLLLPNYASYIATIETVFLLPMIVGELGLGLWLLFKGGKGERTDISRRELRVATS